MNGIKMANLMYLLGMITGKGTIFTMGADTTVDIEIPHKNAFIGGHDASESITLTLEQIRNKIQELIGVTIQTNQKPTSTVIHFSKPQGDYLVRTLQEYFRGARDWKEFEIPYQIFESSRDMQREYMMGLSDVTAHIRRSNNSFGQPYGHRVYIEIPRNWRLVIDICNLLRNLDVPVHTVDWGHPNIRDSNLRSFDNGNRNGSFREHQIKIFAEEFQNIGFLLQHKQIMLKTLSEENVIMWNEKCLRQSEQAKTSEKRDYYRNKINRLSDIHHKYYWETNIQIRNKPIHPLENDPRIPKEIRGRHFDSWTQICQSLGYGNIEA